MIDNTITIKISRADFSQGKEIFNVLETLLSHSIKVHLDFSDCSIITCGFLNTVIGQIYSQFNSAFLQEHLSFNIDINDHEMLQRVINNAKEYYIRKEELCKMNP